MRTLSCFTLLCLCLRAFIYAWIYVLTTVSQQGQTLKPQKFIVVSTIAGFSDTVAAKQAQINSPLHYYSYKTTPLPKHNILPQTWQLCIQTKHSHPRSKKHVQMQFLKTLHAYLFWQEERLFSNHTSTEAILVQSFTDSAVMKTYCAYGDLQFTM